MYLVENARGATIIQEVKARKLTWVEDPSLSWRMQEGESVYCILSPKRLEGERVMSWALYSNEDDAMVRAKRDICSEFERTARKAHVEVDEAALDERLKAVKVVNL